MTTEDFESTYANAGSMEAFRVFYPDTEGCYTDYARRMGEKFSAPAPACEACGARERVCRKVANWEANYQNRDSNRRNLAGLLFLFIGHAHLSRAVLKFTTTHAICAVCASRLAAMRLLTVPLSFVATVLSYAPVVVAILGIFYLILGSAAVDKPGATAWTVVVLALISIPVTFWLRRRADLLTIPRFLRPIAKNPILFRGFVKDPPATA